MCVHLNIRGNISSVIHIYIYIYKYITTTTGKTNVITSVRGRGLPGLMVVMLVLTRLNMIPNLH